MSLEGIDVVSMSLSGYIPAEFEGKSGLYFAVVYDDDSYESLGGLKNTTPTFTTKSSNPNKKPKKLCLTYSNYSGICYIKDIQLEMGAAATEYEPYVTPIAYTADKNGIVKGVTTLYPTTILEAETDNVLIKAEYVKNVNEELNIMPSQNPNTYLVVGANITDVLRYTKQELTAEQKAQIIENLGLADFIRDMIQQNAESIAQNYLDTTIAEEGTW